MSEVLVLQSANACIALITRAVDENEQRLIARALRNTATFRHKLDRTILTKLVVENVSSTFKQTFLNNLKAMDTSEDTTVESVSKKYILSVDYYLGYLILLFQHDSKEISIEFSTYLAQSIPKANKRELDLIAAKVYFYHYRNLELSSNKEFWINARGSLLAAHRTATLRQDYESQAVLINLLLRNYLSTNHYDLADKLVSKTQFPEQAANNQLARYNYYLGRIKAIQLDYTSSNKYLLQAMRKALVTKATSGFQQAVNKVAIIVQLLMGEIPERNVFRQPMLKNSLVPYLKITSAVRVGDLHLFQEALGKFTSEFQRDKTFTLILRLRHNVIKAGIRMLSLSYSRISLRDTCLKLQLDSEEDAEYVVGKAIRDGVVDAVINHEKGYMKSKENVDIYSTNEPQNAFHQRISFCLNLHNESVQAMRFPMNAHKKDLAVLNDLIEEEKKLVNEIANEEDDAEF
ncbi:26S proteasome non-ATPase regulatory subunit [Clydaea vesicula]|uniref:26S proteasome non-ATPase regulatory subunit n=1 Tax=Clydaea vesicula TaxID=447962 RepID=A0AAD5U567_9FUNG|nr:26S proteasome non-ATPase regulatory subunit [Clydaea vesicula]